MLRPRPCSGPASQPIQPPLREGTYCDGSPAAPAAVRKVLVRTPSSPSSPSARSSPVRRSASPWEGRSRWLGDDRAASIGALEGAGAIGIGPLLRLVAGRRVV